ncbi:GP179 protein, partial [Nothocercus julius]|nr:GP179 protein [Nothocercus julius]
PSGTSQSAAKADICPWETQESEGGTKAEICPWESPDAPSDHGKAKQVPGGISKGDKRITRQAALASPARSLEQGGSGRAAACPWESRDTGQPPATPCAGSPGLPKPPSGTSQSAAKADICPWETQESEGGTKAEICPWESPDMAQFAVKPCAGSPGLPKPSSRTSQSAEKA